MGRMSELYVSGATKKRLFLILPRAISVDVFINATLNYMEKNHVSLEKLITSGVTDITKEKETMRQTEISDDAMVEVR